MSVCLILLLGLMDGIGVQDQSEDLLSKEKEASGGLSDEVDGREQRDHLHSPDPCISPSEVDKGRTTLSRRPNSLEPSDDDSDVEPEQTDHCTRGGKVAEGGGGEAVRSHARRVRFATPDASVELYALTLKEVTSVRQSLLSAESPESSIGSWTHVSVGGTI